MQIAKLVRFASFIVLAQGFVSGQDLKFEVVSVKPATPGAKPRREGGPGTNDPEHVRFSAIPMSALFMMAYEIKDYQLSGPGWLAGERYELEAKVPTGTTEEQYLAMLQNVLVERFRAKVHHESKVFSGYELSIAKGGAKLKAAEPPSAATAALIASGARGPAVFTKDRDGLPELPAGFPASLLAIVPGGTRMSVRSRGLESLVTQLELSFAKMPVRDATGLTGKYDFDLTFSLPSRPNADPDVPLPDLYTALEEQLGLKLVAKKLPFDIVVVDSSEKMPTPN